MRLDTKLKEFGNKLQAERLDSVNLHGTYRDAAAALGVTSTAIRQSIAIMERNAARQGYAPEHDMSRTVPDGFQVKGVSTYYNADGKPIGQWVKSSADDVRRKELMEEAFVAMADELPRLESMNYQGVPMSTLCNLYVMTDCHVGMLAWHREGGADWDLKIAERVLLDALSRW